MTEHTKLWTMDEVRELMLFAEVWPVQRGRVLQLMTMIEAQRVKAATEERRAALAEKAKAQPRDERGHFTKRDLSAA